MTNAEKIISGVTRHFAAMDSCRGIALIGSRGRGQHVDCFSDIDFFICVESSLRRKLVSTDWAKEIAPVILQFPLVLPDEVRVMFQGYMDSDFHFYTTEELGAMQGPCQLGDYLSRGWQILYDPRDLLKGLHGRIQPQQAESEADIWSTTPPVFWFNTVLCAKYILRGDLFRAYRMSNWWLQQMLLELLEPEVPEESCRHKNIAVRIPEYYLRLSRCFARLDRKDMIRGLNKSMDLFWEISRDKYPLPPEQQKQFRSIHSDVRKMLAGDVNCLD
ncbi:MAG: aminoglycoside 6-adenylyltransferase [Eubacteriales bacterium]|nr:aminoglycoside 6-adenylyltransferase [Eubacteriales bacterium]MDD4769568.1 aminoglycoside 6-adenylyltransferase [Eubacteriales bacterium]